MRKDSSSVGGWEGGDTRQTRESPATRRPGAFARAAAKDDRNAARWRNYFSPCYCTGRKWSSSFNDRAVAPARKIAGNNPATRFIARRSATNRKSRVLPHLSDEIANWPACRITRRRRAILNSSREEYTCIKLRVSYEKCHVPTLTLLSRGSRESLGVVRVKRDI